MLKPIPLSDVRLLEGKVLDCQTHAGRYVLALEPDRLLHNFRVNAGLPSSAKPLGGWESPECGLRGHFVGHYLSSCAHLYAGTGDERFKDRALLIVVELDACQRALGGEYLSAFPTSQFDTLEREFGGAWAPYYTLHKILAGLLDVHWHTAEARPLNTARRLGDWIVCRMNAVPAERLEPLLRTTEFNPANEYGGIGESLYHLYALTKEPRYLQTAQLFDRDWFLKPLMAGEDQLAGLHANTHVPQMLAAARRYEITAEENYGRAVEFFWERTALARSYVNGGSSGPRPDGRERSVGGEHWPIAFQMRNTLTPKINESCVVHNMLRLTDTVFAWNRDARYAEFRERVFLNSVLAMQHPNQIGSYIYGHPLAQGSRKVFGGFDDTFWCCYGKSVEAFGRLNAGIYYEEVDSLWVTQFISSAATWKRKSVRIEQRTDFPRGQVIRLTIHCERETEFTLVVRVPEWTSDATWRLAGSQNDRGVCDSGFWPIRRLWRDGDQVELNFPMSLRVVPLPGDEKELAFVYGPSVLAAKTSHALELGVPASQAAGAIRSSDTGEMSVRLNFGSDVPLVPITEITDEAFGAYFKST